jgi:hypothetical protein
VDTTLAALTILAYFGVLSLGVLYGMTWVFRSRTNGAAAARLVVFLAAMFGWTAFGIWGAASLHLGRHVCRAGTHQEEVYAGTYQVGQTVMTNYRQECVPDRSNPHAA